MRCVQLSRYGRGRFDESYTGFRINLEASRINFVDLLKLVHESRSEFSRKLIFWSELVSLQFVPS